MPTMQMPNGFFWSLAAPQLPLKAMGAVVIDASGVIVANCPDSSYADAIAYTINVAHGIHQFGAASPCFPYGAPEPNQRNADNMGMPG